MTDSLPTKTAEIKKQMEHWRQADSKESNESGATEHMIAYLEKLSSLPALAAYKAAIIDALHLGPESIVLDAGCGVGLDSIAMAKHAKHVTGVDLAQAMIDRGAYHKAQAGDVGKKVDFVKGSVSELPFPSGHFDAVRVDRVLQHVDNPDKAVAELTRVLKPGGRLVVAEPDWHTLAYFATPKYLHIAQAITATTIKIVPNPAAGRQMNHFFSSVGLDDVAALPMVGLMKNLDDWFLYPIDATVKKMVENDVASTEDVTAFADQIKEQAKKNIFCASLVFYITSGTKKK